MTYEIELEKVWEPWWLATDVSSSTTTKDEQDTSESLERLNENAEVLDEDPLSLPNIHVKANQAFSRIREGVFELAGAMNKLKTLVSSKAFSECSEEKKVEIAKEFLTWNEDMGTLYYKTEHLDYVFSRMYTTFLYDAIGLALKEESK